MQPEVTLRGQVAPERVEHRSDRPAEAASILDQRRDVARHLVEGFVGLPAKEVEGPDLGLDEVVDLAHVDERIAECPRRRGIDLGNDQRRALDCRPRRVHHYAEARVAALVGRGDLHECDVHAHRAALDQRGNRRERCRDEVDTALGERLVRQRAGEERLETEAAFLERLKREHFAQAHDVDQLQIAEVAEVGLHQVANQRPGLTRVRAQEDAHPRLDVPEDVFGRGKCLAESGEAVGDGVHPCAGLQVVAAGATRNGWLDVMRSRSPP